MREQATLGLIAVGLGVVVSVVAFVPFVAHSYRRWGRFSTVRALAWSAALAYFWAIWTYTLLPLPDPDALECAPRNTTPLALLDDLRAAVAGASGRRELLLDAAVMQIGLNVLLFVPLGFFLRVLGGRGIVIATLVGFGLSGFIEVTQLTGVWGLYPCAYRVFDVDDVLLNTGGALIGSIAAFVVPKRHRGRAHREVVTAAVPVTRPRRVLAMVCDLLAYTLISLAVTIGTRAVLLFVGQDRDVALDSPWPDTLGLAVPLAAWFLITVITGRTPGDHAVRIRYVGGPLPEPFARLIRFAAGIGAYGAASLLTEAWAPSAAVVLVAFVATLVSRRGRGLPGLLSGRDVVDVGAPETASGEAG